MMLGIDVDEIELAVAEQRGPFLRRQTMQVMPAAKFRQPPLRFGVARFLLRLRDIVAVDVLLVGGEVVPRIDAVQHAAVPGRENSVRRKSPCTFRPRPLRPRAPDS